MKDIVKLAYLNEVKAQCLYAVSAFRAVLHSMKMYNDQNLPQAHRASYYDEVFRNIQSFLNHAANVSKLFKPQERPITPEKTARVAFLCTEYGITDTHAIHQRFLRNDLEHYDERLDTWSTQGHDSLVQDAIHDPTSPSRTMDLSGADPTLIMRWYNPRTAVFHFASKRYDLHELLMAVQEIGSKTDVILTKPFISEQGEVLTLNHHIGHGKP